MGTKVCRIILLKCLLTEERRGIWGIWSKIYDKYKEWFVESVGTLPQLKKRIQMLEYDFKNLNHPAQNTCTEEECFKKIKEDFPYFDYFDDTISVAFLFYCFGTVKEGCCL